MKRVKDFIPALQWINTYNRSDLRGDLSAGLTVGVMLIPQGMAYSMLAGLPPIYGLYASTIPLVLYAVFGTSRQLAVGPVAMVALLIATGISQLAEAGSADYIALAILLALLVGLIQLLMGVFRLGFLVNFLSHPVISGFTSAAALIIGLSQLKHLLGIDLGRSHFIHEILIEAFSRLAEVNASTFIVGVAGVAIIMVLKKVNKAIPGPLVAVIVSILAVMALNLAPNGVAIVGAIPEGLPALRVPDLTMEDVRSLMPIAITIALIGFMESIAVAKAIQRRHKNYEIDSNQELIGLGVANIGGAFFQAFPTTGGFSRTAVNDQAGARTGLASIVSAALILFTLLFLTPLFYNLPKAILASVIMVAVFGLIDVKEARYLWKVDRKDFTLLVISFLSTLLLGIEAGILVGVGLSLGLTIYKATYPHIARLGKIPDSDVYINVHRFPEAVEQDNLLIVRLDGQMWFANTGYFLDRLRVMERTKPALQHVIFVGGAVHNIDSTAVHELNDLIQGYKERGITFHASGFNGPVRDKMHQSGLMDLIGRKNFHLTVSDAVREINQVEGKSKLKHIASQVSDHDVTKVTDA